MKDHRRTDLSCSPGEPVQSRARSRQRLPRFLPDPDSCRSCERTGMSGVAQRSRGDTRRVPLTCPSGSGSSGGGGREDPAAARSRAQHDRVCPASARTQGPDPPVPHEYPAAPRHGPLGSAELWAKCEI